MSRSVEQHWVSDSTAAKCGWTWGISVPLQWTHGVHLHPWTERGRTQRSKVSTGCMQHTHTHEYNRSHSPAFTDSVSCAFRSI